ncbi:MAG: zinc-binding dehydrogenase [Candidatus Omnitrophica bacterium]|nr:zinc-binding dehydrogenase [Candidatus Omnitrophota bacterium]
MSTRKTKAVIYAERNKPLFIDEISIPEPKPDQAIIKIIASGICGSQLYDLTHPKIELPRLLGHEATGIVVKKGKLVTHVEEGDHVLVSWIPYNADANTEYLKWNTVSWSGHEIKTVLFTWAEHTLLDGQFITKMDKGFEKYTTAVLGCAGVAGYGTVRNIVNIKPGQSVVVFGAGGLGVLAVNAAKNLGANPIIAVDIKDKKLEFSKLFGATHTINSDTTDVVEAIKEITNGGADFVFDMVGIPQIVESTILAAREGVCGFCEGGTTVLVGFPKGAAEFNSRSILLGQRTYKGSRGGACIAKRDFPIFYKDYKEGALLLDQAVTNRYKLDQINEAVQDLSEGRVLGRAIIEIS